jgi:hypothetical protein
MAYGNTLHTLKVLWQNNTLAKSVEKAGVHRPIDKEGVGMQDHTHPGFPPALTGWTRRRRRMPENPGTPVLRGPFLPGTQASRYPLWVPVPWVPHVLLPLMPSLP